VHFVNWDGHPPVESFLINFFLSCIEFLITLFFIPIVLVFCFFSGDKDIAMWEMGRWSSGFGQSCDHVVSSHMHVAVTEGILSAASTFAIGDASGVSTLNRQKLTEN
jgi:hypothetical protein